MDLEIASHIVITDCTFCQDIVRPHDWYVTPYSVRAVYACESCDAHWTQNFTKQDWVQNGLPTNPRVA